MINQNAYFVNSKKVKICRIPFGLTAFLKLMFCYRGARAVKELILYVD